MPDSANMDKQEPRTEDLPLVVDLDGTLTPTDTLVESVRVLAVQQPRALFRLPAWLLRGRSALKAEVAARASLDVRHLPLRAELLTYLAQQKALGRRIVLATAADRSIADAVAARVGLFDAVLASDGAINLKGQAKLAEIRARVGEKFAYAGDSSADLPVWRAAGAALLVDVAPAVARQVRQAVPVEREFPGAPGSWRLWLKAARVHQWLKNMLIFVPLLTSFSFSQVDKIGLALTAFLAFSLLASATYLANDIWDLDTDRAHPRKVNRPFASGAIPIQRGLPVGLSLLAGGMLLGALVSPGFLAVLVAYLASTSAYSFVLKRYVLLDVVMLATLYTMRVVAGAIAIRVELSPWLLAFCVFTFFSLALVKRCSELVSFQRAGRSSASGRDYQVSDLAVLWPLGVGAGLCSVVVFGLFVATVAAAGLYAHANLLWLVGVGLLYWMGRLWIKTSRGEMHDDPIVFTLSDFGTRTVLLLMVATTIAAYI
ncbi:MAG: UbiA family prenyltransferase [Rubrivivax sp.]